CSMFRMTQKFMFGFLLDYMRWIGSYGQGESSIATFRFFIELRGAYYHVEHISLPFQVRHESPFQPPPFNHGIQDSTSSSHFPQFHPYNHILSLSPCPLVLRLGNYPSLSVLVRDLVSDFTTVQDFFQQVPHIPKRNQSRSFLMVHMAVLLIS